MPGQSAERTWISAQIPRNYHTALFARSEREDRSASSLLRAALGSFLFGDAGLRALAEVEQERES